VTLDSREGLYASPEKKVNRPGCSEYCGPFLYSFTTVWKRAIPPTGSADPDSISVFHSKLRTYIRDFRRDMVELRLQSQRKHVLILGETRSCHHPRHGPQKEKENKGYVLLGVLTGEGANEFLVVTQDVKSGAHFLAREEVFQDAGCVVIAGFAFQDGASGFQQVAGDLLR
jgi:hypothetical protein